MSKQFYVRMSGRGFAIGANEITSPIIRETFKNLIISLEKHLKERLFLLGSKPCFGDFGIAAQLYQAMNDPTMGKYMRNVAPRICEWCVRMLNPPKPTPNASFERYEVLKGTLEPFLKRHVAIFLRKHHMQ